MQSNRISWSVPQSWLQPINDSVIVAIALVWPLLLPHQHAIVVINTEDKFQVGRLMELSILPWLHSHHITLPSWIWELHYYSTGPHHIPEPSGLNKHILQLNFWQHPDHSGLYKNLTPYTTEKHNPKLWLFLLALFWQVCLIVTYRYPSVVTFTKTTAGEVASSPYVTCSQLSRWSVHNTTNGADMSHTGPS